MAAEEDMMCNTISTGAVVAETVTAATIVPRPGPGPQPQALWNMLI